jgi:hypothetical protein
MTNLRKEARGRDCQIRIPGICNRRPETTVGCHYRLGTGMGQKPHDLHIAWGCASCHACCDGQMKSTYTREQLRLFLAEAVLRTQAVLIREGKL